jgi:hypothetical protein
MPSAKVKRGNRRENRHERRIKQHAGGGGEWDALSIPDGMELFKPEADTTYHIDVIPYIAGAHNKNADEGDEYFELSYPVYNSIGVEEKRYIAIGPLTGEKDPVHEHFLQLRKDGAEWDDMKDFKEKWRQLFLVFVHEQADKGLQFFEGHYMGFGKLLDEEIQAEEEDWIDNFDDPDGGATLKVRFKSQNIGTRKPWILAGKISFIERDSGFDADGDEKLSAKVMQQASEICLDEWLKIPTYDQLKAALEGVPREEEEEEEEEKPARRSRKPKPKPEPEEEKPARRSRKPKPEPEEETEPLDKQDIAKGDTVDHDKLGPCSVIRVASNGTLTLMDEDDEVHKGIPADEVTISETEEKPKPKAKAASKNPAANKPKTESEDDDDWDEDWED